MKNATIVESNVEPSKENLWLYKGELRQFGPNGWEAVSASDNAPKYVLKVHRNSDVLSLSPGYTPAVRIYSYTEQNGVKEVVSPHTYSALGIVSVSNIRVFDYYMLIIFTKGINGNDLIIIEGSNNRQIVVPIRVTGYNDTAPDDVTTTSTTTTTSTSTKPPVSVKVRNSTSLDLIVSGIMMEGEGVNTASPPIGMGQELICYPRPGASITIKRFGGTILPQLIIKDAITHTEIPNLRDTDGTWYYIECNDILGLIQEGLTTIEVVEDTTSSLE